MKNKKRKKPAQHAQVLKISLPLDHKPGAVYSAEVKSCMPISSDLATKKVYSEGAILGTIKSQDNPTSEPSPDFEIVKPIHKPTSLSPAIIPYGYKLVNGLILPIDATDMKPVVICRFEKKRRKL